MLNQFQDLLEKTDLVIIHTEWNDFKSLDFLKLIKKY